MSRNGRNNRCKSANMRRCRDNRLHVVELTLSDVVGPANISPPTKFEANSRQQENCQRPGTGCAEIYYDDGSRTLPHYPSDNALNVEGDFSYDAHLDSANILNSQRKSFRNTRYQVAPESDYGNRPVRPYRPISSHQYLTSTELKDSSLQDKNLHLGRPTRTTLLRERQRRRSVPAVDVSHHLLQKVGQKQDPHTPTRYEAVKHILTSMIPSGQSLHSFISGARYNRSNWIETLGSVDLASDQPGNGGSNLNVTHQRQKSTSDQLDVDYTPRAPPESPVDFNNAPAKDGSTGAFLPVLSVSGSVEPTSPLPKSVQENRSRKIAWEEEIKRLSPLPDRAPSTQEKVRFQTDESVTLGSIPAAHHHERTHHTARPSSVRAPTTQVVKPGRDMAAVVVHGISLHGSPSARDSSFPHPILDPSSSDGPRRSWSATTYTGSARPPSMEFNRFDSLKVTGVKVSGGGSTVDPGRVGLRLSALKAVRLETDAESTEALVGSRCEGYSDAGRVAEAAGEHGVLVASGRSSPSRESDREVRCSEDVDHDQIDPIDREINTVEDADHEIHTGKDVDHEIDSGEDANHEIHTGEDDNNEIHTGKDADHDNIDPTEDADHEVNSLRSNDLVIDPNREFYHRIGSDEMIAGKIVARSDHKTDHDHVDHLSETNESIENDQIDPDCASPEQSRASQEKLGQVNVADESREEKDAALAEVGRVITDGIREHELGRVGTRGPSAKRGQDAQLGQVSNVCDLTKDDDRERASEDGRNWRDASQDAEDGGVVFFITEEQLNNPEKSEAGCHDDRVTEDERKREADEGEKEFGDDEAGGWDAVNEDGDGIAEDADVASVIERSVRDTTQGAGRRN